MKPLGTTAQNATHVHCRDCGRRWLVWAFPFRHTCAAPPSSQHVRPRSTEENR